MPTDGREIKQKQVCVTNFQSSNVQDVHANATRMLLVPCRSEFVVRKLTFSGCHGRHPLNSVRDCSDSFFAVCFKQQQLLQCRRKNVAPVESNGKKLQAKSPTLLFYYHLQKQ